MHMTQVHTTYSIFIMEEYPITLLVLIVATLSVVVACVMCIPRFDYSIDKFYHTNVACLSDAELRDHQPGSLKEGGLIQAFQVSVSSTPAHGSSGSSHLPAMTEARKTACYFSIH